ncbi:hypothetical protein BDD12DRAFT_887888 [Trichophaea hybrida]|nr:hypothetical protein BDD12DRAFT_887888 [Trichophaea hybrida]
MGTLRVLLHRRNVIQLELGVPTKSHRGITPPFTVSYLRLLNMRFLLSRQILERKDRWVGRGKTIVDYTRCVFDALNLLYELGARRFVLLNIAPLGIELAPLYAADSEPGPDRYWKGKEQNTTQISLMMAEVVVVNKIFDLHAATHKLHDTKLAVIDAYGLFKDIYAHPERYLNGAVPLDIKGYNSHCNVDSLICWEYRIEGRDAFM